MSVLSRKELHVVLCPGHVALLALEHRLTVRGFRHSPGRREVVAATTAPAGAPARRQHDRVLLVLNRMLAGHADGKVSASVVLSNHFSRYVLVPWSDSLGNDAERMAYALHCFRELYGDRAERWEFRLSPEQDGLPQLASAVDRRLLAALRETFALHGIALASIQPHLMAAYNGVHPSLKRRDAWLGLVEPGNLCLGLLQQGRLARLRSMRIGAEWQAALPQLLEREACLAGVDERTNEVLLIAPDEAPLSLPAEGGWRYRRLQPAPRRGTPPTGEWGFAMVGSG